MKVKAPRDPNAPKRPRGRPRKDDTTPRVKKEGQDSSSSSESGSEDDLEIDDEPPEPRPALLVVTPPSDLGSKALYDAVQAVWSPRNKPAVGDNIRSGVKLFGEAVKGLRDAWKTKNESLRKAELPNSGNPEAAAALKTAVARLRTNMETLMQRSLVHGHPAHLMRYVSLPQLCVCGPSTRIVHGIWTYSWILETACTYVETLSSRENASNIAMAIIRRHATSKHNWCHDDIRHCERPRPRESCFKPLAFVERGDLNWSCCTHVTINVGSKFTDI